MKKGLIIGFAATAVAAAVASLVSVRVSAGPVREPVARADGRATQQIMPARKIVAGVRAAGDILSIESARRDGAYRMAYGGGPRIIHVPQPDDDVATGDYRDNVSGDDADHVEDVADPEPPKPVRRTDPARGHRSTAPTPVQRRSVTSAPPPPPRAAADDKNRDQALTPVHPTPDFAGGGKFDPPPREN